MTPILLESDTQQETLPTQGALVVQLQKKNVWRNTRLTIVGLRTFDSRHTYLQVAHLGGKRLEYFVVALQSVSALSTANKQEMHKVKIRFISAKQPRSRINGIRSGWSRQHDDVPMIVHTFGRKHGSVSYL